MRKLVLGLVLVGVMGASTLQAGQACKLAEEFRWMSVAQNTACIVEFLWEIMV